MPRIARFKTSVPLRPNTIRRGSSAPINRATARADELNPAELRTGSLRLTEFVRRHRPRVVAVAGITAYRTALSRPHASGGEQPETLAGARLWVVPNPSGLNAHENLDTLAEAYAAPARAAGVLDG